jgi:mono/diheme cytochrome c family protein
MRTDKTRTTRCCATFLAVFLTFMGIGGIARAVDTNELFLKTCAPCHSKDGKAQTPAAKKLGVKDLSQSKLTDEQIVQQILEGKQDPKKASKMPAFKEKLSKEEIDALVSIVKSFRK